MLLFVILNLCLVTCFGDSHTQERTVTAMVSKQHCYQQSRENCRACGFLWLRRCCNTYYVEECSVGYETVTLTKTECLTGWTSSNCDVPICDPPCSAGKACTRPNVCECVSTGASCTSVPCDPTNNCYPGSCANQICKCPSSFAGPNCLSIIQTPEIQTCSVQLIASGIQVAQADCSAPGLSPPVTWISGKNLTSLQASAEAVYTNKNNMPDAIMAPYLQNAPVQIGVTYGSLLVNFSTNPGNPTAIFCTQVSLSSPTDDGKCQYNTPWSQFGITLAHNVSFTVTARASLGGQKTGKNDQTANSGFASQQFNGNLASRSVLFKVDAIKPDHCLSNPANDCPMFPIYLDKDIRTDPQIQPTFQNWTDDGSGIVNFHVEIYFMQPGGSGLLVNTMPSLQTSDISPALNNFIYVCRTSGVYSIELTVLDQANNSAKARKLFVYSGDSKLKKVESNPVYAQEADPSTGYTWINNLNTIRRDINNSYILTLDWTGRFTSSASFSGSWGLGAEAWSPNTGIDDLDSYKNRYGFRTISALTNFPNGITSYSVRFTVDKTSGGIGLPPPPSMASLNSTSNTYQMAVPSIPDGSAIVIWLECNDIAGGLASEKLTINVDVTPPAIATNFTFTPKSIDEFTSSVFIWAFDEHSGVKYLNFSISDQTLKQIVHSDTAPVHSRDPPTINNNRRKRQNLEQPCTPDDKTCYCIPKGPCFNYIQRIDIDHCWIDRYAGHPFQLKLNVSNLAGLTRISTIDLGVLTDIPCRPQPTVGPLSGGAVAGIVIGVIIGVVLVIAAAIIIVLLIRVYAMKKPVPAAVKSFKQKFYGSPVTTDNELYMTSSPKENKLFSEKDNRFRENFAEKGLSKLEHQQNDDVYIYSADSDYIANPNQMSGYWIPKEKVEVESVLKSGRMMVVSKAYLTDGNQRNAVAVKALKNGFSQKDLKLMDAKISFMAKLRPHVNIVKFVGAIRNDNNEGPIIVMEFCETTLQQWLTDNSSITVDVLENMLTFCWNIARGLEHLHALKIIHTRLAARNVLLAKQFGGFVAKLIGFGPSRESEGDDKKVAVPVKWLAPETLKTVNSSKPTYNEKTDVWSFAVTVWEIYSKGEKQPYPDVPANEAKNRIRAGEKMECPENCPYELFNKVVYPCWEMDPGKRPNMKTVSKLMEDFRSGNGSEPIGYYDTKEGYYGESETRGNGSEAMYDEAK